MDGIEDFRADGGGDKEGSGVIVLESCVLLAYLFEFLDLVPPVTLSSSGVSEPDLLVEDSVTES